jgi:hypothetical protein
MRIGIFGAKLVPQGPQHGGGRLGVQRRGAAVEGEVVIVCVSSQAAEPEPGDTPPHTRPVQTVGRCAPIFGFQSRRVDGEPDRLAGAESEGGHGAEQGHLT